MMNAVIFDVDNVVMNSREQQALSWREALRHFCQFVPLELIRRKLSEQGAEALKSYFSAQALKKYQVAFSNHVALVFNDKYQARIQVRPHMYDLLGRLLHSGWQIGLIATAGQEALRGNKRLAHLEAFLKIRTRFAAQDTEPALTEVLQDAMVVQAISDPAEVLVVCATPALARAARALHMQVVGFTGSGFSAVELRAAGCSEVCATSAELVQVIERRLRPSSSNLWQRQPQERLATLQQMNALTIKL
jgi:beta-phosphoglucomutase-like phosphatase (HAD superfamily)